MNKQNLRRQLLQQRQQLTESVWREKSQQLCQQLIQMPLFQSAQTVLSYGSIRQEPDLHSLFTLNKQWGLSRCVNQDLIWHLWQPQMPLQKGAYGILEPTADAPLIDPHSVDLILVPALACDRRGYRLGYGGGYYDRLLAQPIWAKIPTIGIIFDFGYFSELPADPWDIPLSGACTEFSAFWFKERT